MKITTYLKYILKTALLLPIILFNHNSHAWFEFEYPLHFSVIQKGNSEVTNFERTVECNNESSCKIILKVSPKNNSTPSFLIEIQETQKELNIHYTSSEGKKSHCFSSDSIDRSQKHRADAHQIFLYTTKFENLLQLKDISENTVYELVDPVQLCMNKQYKSSLKKALNLLNSEIDLGFAYAISRITAPGVIPDNIKSVFDALKTLVNEHNKTSDMRSNLFYLQSTENELILHNLGGNRSGVMRVSSNSYHLHRIDCSNFSAYLSLYIARITNDDEERRWRGCRKFMCEQGVFRKSDITEWFKYFHPDKVDYKQKEDARTLSTDMNECRDILTHEFNVIEAEHHGWLESEADEKMIPDRCYLFNTFWCY